MLACWVENPNGIHFKKHLLRVSDYLWVAEDGMKMQVSMESNLLITRLQKNFLSSSETCSCRALEVNYGILVLLSKL